MCRLMFVVSMNLKLHHLALAFESFPEYFWRYFQISTQTLGHPVTDVGLESGAGMFSFLLYDS